MTARVFFNFSKLPLKLTNPIEGSSMRSPKTHLGGQAGKSSDGSCWVRVDCDPWNLKIIRSDLIDFLQQYDGEIAVHGGDGHIRSTSTTNVVMGRGNLPLGIHDAIGNKVAIVNMGNDKVAVSVDSGTIDGFLETWNKLAADTWKPEKK